MARLSDKKKEQIKAMLASGLSQRKIAKDLNVSVSTVNKWSKDTKDEVEQMRTQKKEQWVNEAWKTINMYVQHVQKDEVVERTSARDSAILIGTLHDKMIKSDELNLKREEIELKRKEIAEKSKAPDNPNISVYINALREQDDVWDEDE